MLHECHQFGLDFERQRAELLHPVDLDFGLGAAIGDLKQKS